MTQNNIIRTQDLDRRNTLCKTLGYRYTIVYRGTEQSGARTVACNQRLRVKQWANQKLGRPCTKYNLEPDLINTDSEWYQGYNKQQEYIIAFRQKNHRDFAILL